METASYEKVILDYLTVKEQLKNLEAREKKLKAIILSDPSFDSFKAGTQLLKKMSGRVTYKLKEYTPEQLINIQETYAHCFKLDPTMLAKEDETLVERSTAAPFLQVYAVKPDDIDELDI